MSNSDTTDRVNGAKGSLRLVDESEGKEAAEDFDGVDLDEEYVDDTLPSSGLLSFYDRLRAQITEAIDQRSGKWGQRTVEALLLVPDVFILLTRLALDKDVPKESRTLVAGALAYFLLPIDLMPEAVIGPVGYLDDLVLALSVLSQAFSGEMEPYLEKYWSGSRKVREVMRDILVSADRLLGNNLFSRLKALLRKKGVDLDQASS